MLTKRPLTIVLILCGCAVCVSVAGALVCQDNNKCGNAFQLPISALVSVVCVILLFTLFYVESMGHSTGMGTH